MHHLKRIAAVITALLLTVCLVPAAMAAADSDSFQEEHAAQCTEDGHSYYLNGRSGYVSVYRTPLSQKPCDYLLNERCLTVLCIWQDSQGRQWGQLRYESTDRGVGRSVELGDGAGLRDAIVELLEAPALCAEMGARAKRLYAEKYSYETAMEKYEKLMDTLCRG